MLKKLILKKFLVIINLIFFVSCSNLKIGGNLQGNEQKVSNDLIFTYSLHENLNFKSRISKPYNYKNNLDVGIPEYAESGLFFDF